MKALTFLGTGEYKDAIYHYNGQDAQSTKFFPVALCELQPKGKIDEFLVVVTKESKDKWFSKLEESFGKFGVNVTPVEIPSTHSVEDLWTIFFKITDQLPENDEVIFDITHSFRTLPFLAFLAAAYLITAKKVVIKGLFYGAFDAGQGQEPKRVPVFDLTPFLDLLKWITATDKFLTTGYSKDLGGLLGEIAERRRDQLRSDPAANQFRPISKLKGLGKDLKELSDALSLNRPKAIKEKAESLNETLGDQYLIAAVEQLAPPAKLLLNKIADQFEPFVSDDLDAHRRLIHWYVQNEQFVQGYALIREWIISYICKKAGREIYEQKHREPIEKAISLLAMPDRNVDNSEPTSRDVQKILKFCKSLKYIDKLVKLWQDVSGLRNDVMHFGFRPNASKPATLIESIKKFNLRIQSIDVDND